MAILNPKLRVMHIISGDLWAGAEAQAYTLLTQLNQIHELLVILMNQGELSERLCAANIPVVIIDEKKYSSTEIIKAIKKQLQVFHPDVIHTHRQKENILGNIANFLSIRAKSVRTTHGAPEFSPSIKQKVQIGIDNFVGRYLQQGIIAVSADLYKKLLHSFPRSKLYIIQNGVDVNALRQQLTPVEWGKGENNANVKHIGIIGRLTPVKRLDLFLQTAALLAARPESNYSFVFHIIGEGGLRAELEQLAKDLNISDITLFHGHRKDIASCIWALDLVVMCSDHEGTPMVALEALALNTHLLAHNVGGLQEILRNEPLALVDPQSPEAYAKALLILLEAPPPTLPNEYTAAANAAKTSQLYQDIL